MRKITLFKKILLAAVVLFGSVVTGYGQESIYSGNFLSAGTKAYTVNWEFTLGAGAWTASIGQLNSSVFYLGTNGSNTVSGQLQGTPNSAGKWNNVIGTWLANDDRAVTATTQAYALNGNFAAPLSNAGEIVFNWVGGNTTFDMFLMADITGNGTYTLLKKSTSVDATTFDKAGSMSYTFDAAETIYNICLVISPTNLTATSGTLRLTTVTVNSFDTGGPSTDATLKSLKVGENAIALVAGKFNYDYELPYGTTVMPAVTAEANSAAATIDWENAIYATISGIEDETGDVTTFDVIAEDETTTNTYSITFTISTTAAPSFLAVWNFNGIANTNTAGGGSTFAATTFAANLVSAKNEITRGTDAAWSTGTNSFRTVGFKNDGISTSNNDYFQVTLEPQAGYKLSLSTIDAAFTGTQTFVDGSGVTAGTGPGVSNQFAYSLNGTEFTLIGSPQILTGITNASTPLILAQIDLTGIAALQNVTGKTITLRCYASGQTATGGWGFHSPNAATNGLAIGGFIETGTVGIDNVKDTNIVSVVYFNLQGIKVEKPTTGFYIEQVTYDNGVVKNNKVVK